MTVRENSDELTFRAEEVCTLKTYIDVNHIEEERWGLLLVDYDYYAFFQALFEGIEREDWGDMYEAHKEMSRVVEVKRPQEARKAKVPLENEGGQGGG